MLYSIIFSALAFTGLSLKEEKVTRLPGLETKGPCEYSKECRDRVFDGAVAAPCMGTYSCLRATFSTTGPLLCAGASACFMTKFDTTQSERLACNGYKSCERSQGLESTNKGNGIAAEKIACNGFQSCAAVNGGIDGDKILCDGSLACSNYRNTLANEGVGCDVTADVIKCNGKRACYEGIITVDDFLACDGEGACSKALIRARQMTAYGKNVAGRSKMQLEYAQLFGCRAAASSQIIPLDGVNQLSLYGYGFKSLANATIDSRGTTLRLFAYGYKATVGATVDCGVGSTCYVNCRGTGCQKLTVLYTKKSEVIVTPAECQQTGSKKFQGTWCPVVALEEKSETLEKFTTVDEEKYELEVEEYLDDMFDTYEPVDKALASVYDAQETQQFFQQLALSTQSTAVSTLVISNLLTCACVLLICFAATWAYSKCTGNKQYKSLAQ